ncbi:MAG: hypothetical protein LM574_00380 [Archaeoglobus sp.]|jgi:hypothetical protein|nr:hypothetical protein [Archaeoglobus sp.]
MKSGELQQRPRLDIGYLLRKIYEVAEEYGIAVSFVDEKLIKMPDTWR